MRRQIDVLVLESAPATPSSEEKYEQRMEEERRRWREQDQRRFVNPDRDPELDAVWVVYVWRENEWHLAGFRRKKPLRRKEMTLPKLFGIVRNQLKLGREEIVKLVSLQDAHVSKHFPPPAVKQSHVHMNGTEDERRLLQRAPRRRPSLRPEEPPEGVFDDIEAPEQGVREVPDGSVVFTSKTRYVAWGKKPRRTDDGKWWFLGPCLSQKKRESEAEIRRRFSIYPDVRVVEVRTLSYSLRSRIRDSRVVAGSTRMHLPPNVQAEDARLAKKSAS